jgi:hypothetical protein
LPFALAAAPRRGRRSVESKCRSRPSRRRQLSAATPTGSPTRSRSATTSTEKRRVDAVTERALAKLARVRVPVEWYAQHSDLERRLVAYLAASRRLHATVEGDINPPATEAAARDFERAQADLSEFLREESREFVAYWRGPGVRHDDR